MSSQLFCNYTLLDELGRGGVSTVYHARDNRSGNDVALKVLNPQLQNNELARARFRREPKMQFLHPKIVPVLDAGLCDGRMFFTMALIAGEPLERMLTRGPLAPRQIYSYVRDVAEALDAAHQRGIIHRDIKPSNILIRSGDNTALLTDFGVAKSSNPAQEALTQTDLNPVGTADYMSPEIARAAPTITPASDVYSLGVSVYHALAGRLPFVADNPVVMAHKHASEAPPDLRVLQPKVPPEVSAVVMRALAKEPDQRYPSAGAFAHAFTEAVMQSQSTPASPSQPTTRRLAMLVGALAALALAVGGLYLASGLGTHVAAPTALPTSGTRLTPNPMAQASKQADLPATKPVLTALVIATPTSSPGLTPSVMSGVAPGVTAIPLPGTNPGTSVPTATMTKPMLGTTGTTATPAAAAKPTLDTTVTPSLSDAATATLVPTASVPAPIPVTPTPRGKGTPAADTLQVEVNGNPSYQRWGRPLTPCSPNTDDKSPVMRFEVSLNLTNLGTRTVAKLNAAFADQQGSVMVTCIQRPSGPLEPGQSSQFVLATYTDGPPVGSLTLVADGETHKLCFAGDTVKPC